MSDVASFRPPDSPEYVRLALRLVTPEHLENLNRQKQLASAEALLAMPARV